MISFLFQVLLGYRCILPSFPQKHRIKQEIRWWNKERKINGDKTRAKNTTSFGIFWSSTWSGFSLIEWRNFQVQASRLDGRLLWGGDESNGRRTQNRQGFFFFSCSRNETYDCVVRPSFLLLHDFARRRDGFRSPRNVFLVLLNPEAAECCFSCLDLLLADIPSLFSYVRHLNIANTFGSAFNYYLVSRVIRNRYTTP